MSTSTTGELALTKYSSGEQPWSHSTGLDTIDSKVSDLMHGKFRDAITVSDITTVAAPVTAAGFIDLTSGQVRSAGTALSYPQLAAGILAHCDVDPQAWLPGVEPFHAAFV